MGVTVSDDILIDLWLIGTFVQIFKLLSISGGGKLCPRGLVGVF